MPMMPSNRAHQALRRAVTEALESRRLLAAGDLVTSFGNNGFVAFDLDGLDTQSLRVVAEMPDGDLIAAGATASFSTSEANEFLVRFNSDGSFDTGFNGDGILALPQDDGATGFVDEIVPLPDGDILIARRTSSGTGGDITRFNGAGTVDTGFATGGTLTISSFTPDLALLPSGEIVVAGGTIVRVYNANGTPRSSDFERDLLTQAGISSFSYADVDTDSTGNIYIAGDVDEGSDPRASVFKFGNDLFLDTSYGTGGEARRNYFTLDIFNVRTLDIDSTGRALIAINEDDAENNITRFTAAGAIEIDQSFSFESDAGPLEENELELALNQPDGKILAGGFFAPSTNDVVPALARLNTNGSADSGFGNGTPAAGQQQYSLGTEEAFLSDMLITEDDDLVFVGRRIDLPGFNADAIIAKVDLGDIGGDDGGNGGDTIGDVAGLSELDGGTLRLTGTGGGDEFSYATEDDNGRAVLAFTRADAGTGENAVTARYFADTVSALVVEGLDGSDDVELLGLAVPATLIGGAGNDLLSFDAGTARLEGGGGNDALTAGGSNDLLLGGDGNDTLNSGAGDDVLDGGAGGDSIIGGAGNDVADYSSRSGNLTIVLNGSAADGEEGEGDNVSTTIEVVLGGSGNDRLETTGGAAVQLVGNGGNDTLIGVSGADTLEGGAGNDSMTGGGGADSVTGGGGNDTVVITEADGDFSAGTYAGDDGSDTLDFSPRTSGVTLTDSGPHVTGSFEVIVGTDAADSITLVDIEGGGTTEVRAGGGDDAVDASARTQPVRVLGGSGADTLTGGAANDVFLPGAEDGQGDIVQGGGGFDILDFSSATADLVLIRGSLGDTDTSIEIGDDVEIAWAGSGNDDIFGFLRTRAGDGDDTLTGSREEDSALFGQSGNDHIFSLFANLDGAPEGRQGDYLDGGAGNDTLNGGVGHDTFAGGLGNDTYEDDGGDNVVTFANMTNDTQTGVIIDLSQRTGTFSAGLGTHTLSSITFTDAIGTRYADEIRGNELPNYLVGGDGDDTLFGGDQKDILLGNAGGDRLDGGDDFDLLFGDTDTGDEDPITTDLLIGAAGFDRGLGDEDDERETLEVFFTSLNSLLSQL